MGQVARGMGRRMNRLMEWKNAVRKQNDKPVPEYISKKALAST